MKPAEFIMADSACQANNAPRCYKELRHSPFGQLGRARPPNSVVRPVEPRLRVASQREVAVCELLKAIFNFAGKARRMWIHAAINMNQDYTLPNLRR
jgi:hypothetical protein